MNTLRRKLATTFVALGLLGLLVIGVTSYTVVQWRASEEAQARHYTRSLLLQEVRTLTFEAYKEVPDALLGTDADARQDYEDRLDPIGEVFREWADLVEDDAERAQVEAVREAFVNLDEMATGVFDLADTGDVAAAAGQIEIVEDTALDPFDRVTTAAVSSDRAKRNAVRAEAAEARSTANLALGGSALGVLSLLLLVGAYLAGGVFGPIRALQQAMSQLVAGEHDTRLPEDGDDEIARVNRDYNLLAARASLGGGSTTTAGDGAGTGEGGAVEDARFLLERLVGGLHDETGALHARLSGPDAESAAALLAQVEATRAALARLGSLAHPVRLDLAPVDPMVLLHEVFDRVDDEVIRRSISTRIHVAPGTGSVHADRARLRETLAELVRNALDALPATGGTLELSAGPGTDGWAVLEVTDDGSGLSDDDLAWLYDDSQRPADTRGVGLKLATSAVESHGGRLQLETQTSGGTTARILLPPHPTSPRTHRGQRP